MNIFSQIIDIALHLDKHLTELISNYGMLTYLILFGVVFSETGLVVFPFLPGDSLLFASGAVAGTTGQLHIGLLVLVLFVAAFTGNMVNYRIGNYLGPRVYMHERIWFINRRHLERTRDFFNRHGAKAVVISRFLPIFRTYVPFVAGLTGMDWRKFTVYNFVGALLWTGPITLAGYWLGSNKFVKDNFSVIILATIIVTFIPALVSFGRDYFKKGPRNNQ